ncbi:MAG: hypothetical protein R3E51_08510 [Rhizobiaceae bacterium]
MPAPRVVIDLDIIAENTRKVATGLGEGVAIFGVTKATCGSPLVARAMLRRRRRRARGSAPDNVQRMRNAGITAPMLMLRIPR